MESIEKKFIFDDFLKFMDYISGEFFRNEAKFRSYLKAGNTEKADNLFEEHLRDEDGSRSASRNKDIQAAKDSLE